LSKAADPLAPNEAKQRPLPIPCDATGLALSGGGVRSAAVGLGVLQALAANGRLGSFDYISTVSGGGYIGGALTAGLAQAGATAARYSPFGDGVEDSPAVAHLRDYSNYLLPRGRSAVANWADVIAILARGLVGNAIPVSATILLFALITVFAYPEFDALTKGGYLPSLLDRCLKVLAVPLNAGPLPLRLNTVLGHWSFAQVTTLIVSLVVVLAFWAVGRSTVGRTHAWSDADSRTLRWSRYVVIAVVVSAFLDIQPVAIHALAVVLHPALKPQSGLEFVLAWAFSPFRMIQSLHGGAAFAGAVAALSTAAHTLRTILTEAQSAEGWIGASARTLARLGLFVLGAMIVPLALWGAYLYLTYSFLDGWTFIPQWGLWSALLVFAVLAALTFCLDANAYSLIRFYRDRLSRAFLCCFGPNQMKVDSLKLSGLRASLGPYPIINSALNVEGSRNANTRGRNADFFTFTPDFVGSDLTLYAPTAEEANGAPGMEELEPALDLPTAVAISGAAFSANMGADTIKGLTPTLALLNVRLGYWMRNPRVRAMRPVATDVLEKAKRIIRSKLWLFVEMFSLLDETSPHIYLTDGGHIDNLGLYELLKRGCKLIVVMDAEADPDMTFGALQIVERYARIDFGVRLSVPWQDIAARTRAVSAAIDKEGTCAAQAGPHCAIGRITYADGAESVLVYIKSSLTGDEKDYVLDYKRRNPSFPHETTTRSVFHRGAVRGLPRSRLPHGRPRLRWRGSHLMEQRRGRLSFLGGSARRDQ
jgi:hypothetical protein